MSVVYLDSCHLCGEPVAGGVFCRRCLAYAADTVNQLPAVAAGAPKGSGRSAAPVPWDGAPTGAAVESSAPRLPRTSGVIPAASMAATTRTRNTRRRSASRAASTGA